jgi:YfiH family protein
MSINYHFFGKDCLIDRALSSLSNLESALKEKNIFSETVLFVNQVHGNQVVTVDDQTKIHGNQDLPKADAIVTNLKNVVIGVITADCSPILFFDKEKNIIAATHAGWRGAKFGVILETISEMKKLGAKNIEAVIGPMIQQKSYEVSKEFFDDFLTEDSANKKFFIAGESADKYLFDLPSYVEEKITKAGVSKIQNQRIDTYTNEADFFSYRRSTHRKESDCGRNVSVIAIK